jgi:hypothetical protein
VIWRSNGSRRVGRKSKDTRHAGQDHRDGSDIYAPCVVWGRFCPAALMPLGGWLWSLAALRENPY